MCSSASDDYGPAGWETLDWFFGRAAQKRRVARVSIRPTDPLFFFTSACGDWEAEYGRWGLVPPGMSLSEAKQFAAFNARIETLATRPMFRQAFLQRQRCVIPLAAFHEWPGKVKARIERRDGKPLLAAGLWATTDTPDGPLVSCTMITRPPTADLMHVHDRMPALLLTRDLEMWLHGPTHQAALAAYTSWPIGILRAAKA